MKTLLLAQINMHIITFLELAFRWLTQLFTTAYFLKRILFKNCSPIVNHITLAVSNFNKLFSDFANNNAIFRIFIIVIHTKCLLNEWVISTFAVFYIY